MLFNSHVLTAKFTYIVLLLLNITMVLHEEYHGKHAGNKGFSSSKCTLGLSG